MVSAKRALLLASLLFICAEMWLHLRGRPLSSNITGHILHFTVPPPSATNSSTQPSPHHSTPSPHHSTPSPHHSTPSPHHSTPSPHHSTPSPHHSTPSPHHSTPSPHHSTPSPHHSTPNPHHSTPSNQPGLDPLALQYRVAPGADNPSLPTEFWGGAPLLRLRTYPSQPRNETCRQCFRYVYRHVLRPRSCDAPGDVRMLVLVTTVPAARAARAALRHTWLSVTAHNTASIRHVFLLGAGWPTAMQEQMHAENQQHGDILLDDFVDSYVNLSIKVMGGFRFALERCRHAEYVMRTADDNYVNLPNVLQMIAQKPPQLVTGLVGMCWERGAYVVRNKRNKWAVSWSEWPRTRYPPYCGGTTFLMTRHTMRMLFDGAQNVPFFVLEDVYFGEVSRLLNISQKSLPHFGLNVPKIVRHANAMFCPLHPDWRSLHPVPPLSMMSIWKHCQKVKMVS